MAAEAVFHWPWFFNNESEDCSVIFIYHGSRTPWFLDEIRW